MTKNSKQLIQNLLMKNAIIVFINLGFQATGEAPRREHTELQHEISSLFLLIILVVFAFLESGCGSTTRSTEPIESGSGYYTWKKEVRCEN
jgi:hypothetical protein